MPYESCPSCGGPYDHSEAACQGDYESNWTDEEGNWYGPDSEEVCENGTCSEANGGCDCPDLQ